MAKASWSVTGRAFPFGFGLSHTTFGYAKLRLEQDQLRPDDRLAATVEVTNTGQVAGDEVVQLYIAAQGSAVERTKGVEGIHPRHARAG